MELRNRIINNLEWSNKRLKLIGKGLDEEQMEIIEFTLLNDIEQLNLSSVSQQRELLNALADDFNESTDTYVGQKELEEWAATYGDDKEDIRASMYDAVLMIEFAKYYHKEQLNLFGVVSTCCAETRKVNQFLKRPSKYCMTCSKELK